MFNKIKLYVFIVIAAIALIAGIYLVVDFNNTAKELVDAESIGITSSSHSKGQFYQDYEEMMYENQNDDENAGGDGSVIPEPSPTPGPEPTPNPTPEPEPGCETIDFTNNGYSKYCYTYMAWQKVKSPSSKQYRWRKLVYPDWTDDSLTSKGGKGAFDSEGFGKVGDRYVVAVSNIADGGVGAVGQKLDVYLDNGLVLKCIVGDIKSKGDPNWTKWGHLKGNGDTLNTIEFVVDYNIWYVTGKSNPGNPDNHPEWKGNVTKIIRYPNEYNL